MMVAVFATMSLALICGWIGRRWLAVAMFVGCLLLTLLTAYAIKLAILGGNEYLRAAEVTEFPIIRALANVLSVYVIVIGLINLVSVLVQCGFGECHTFGYKLLD